MTHDCCDYCCFMVLLLQCLLQLIKSSTKCSFYEHSQYTLHENLLYILIFLYLNNEVAILSTLNINCAMHTHFYVSQHHISFILLFSSVRENLFVAIWFGISFYFIFFLNVVSWSEYILYR